MPKIDSPCFCLNIRRAALAVTEVYDRKMALLSITANQYSILRHMDFLAPCSTSALAEAMGLDRTTLSRNLKPLIERGLLSDLADTQKRNHRYRLSATGKKLLNRAQPLWEKSQAQLEKIVGETSMPALMRILRRLQEL